MPTERCEGVAGEPVVHQGQRGPHRLRLRGRARRDHARDRLRVVRGLGRPAPRRLPPGGSVPIEERRCLARSSRDLTGGRHVVRAGLARAPRARACGWACRARDRCRRQLGPVVAHTVTATGSTLCIEGESAEDVWVSMVGPRAATPPVQAVREGSRFQAELSLYDDEWGLTPTSLPADSYELRAHTKNGTELSVSCAHSLWRDLPSRIDSDEWTLVPSVDPAGHVTSGSCRWSGRTAVRRSCGAACATTSTSRPGRSRCSTSCCSRPSRAGAPATTRGHLCGVRAAADSDLDLVYSVIDRSNVPPPGARTGDPLVRGVVRAAGPRPLPGGERLPAVLLPQAGGAALLPDLARHAAEADRPRPAAPGLLQLAPPPPAAGRPRRLGLPAQPEPSSAREFLSSAFRYTGP